MDVFYLHLPCISVTLGSVSYGPCTEMCDADGHPPKKQAGQDSLVKKHHSDYCTKQQIVAGRITSTLAPALSSPTESSLNDIHKLTYDPTANPK